MRIVQKFSVEEERANWISHAVASLLSVVALVLLIIYSVRYGDSWYTVSFSIYGTSLIVLYVTSSIYHGVANSRLKKIFEKLDHSSIYILIAGSYTPFCLTVFRGKMGWTIFGIQWGLAVIGIIFKCLWIDRYIVASTFVYVLMGWFIVFFVKPLYAYIGLNGMSLLVAGGLSYTLGLIFFGLPLFKYHHTVWHLFVVAGSLFHFLSILLYLLPR
jgi:hemolysin III